MMTDDEIIAVVQAHKEGKQIEYCSNPQTVWFPLTQSYEWGKFDSRQYRVKPEPRKPREWTLVLEEGTNKIKWWFIFNEQFMGDENCVRVREVIEDTHYCS